MDGMMAGMKTQMVMMVPQMVIMGWINFFFQGFVLSEFLSSPSHLPPPLAFAACYGAEIQYPLFLLLLPMLTSHMMLSTTHSTCRS